MQFRSLSLAAAATLLASAPLALGQADCEVAKTFMPWATVNCDYVWENGGGNNSCVTVKISGTGQSQNGWCKGIWDNIVGDCGNKDHHIINCAEDNMDTLAYGFNPDTGEEIEMYGIDLNIHMDKWDAGEDNKGCVTSAIRKATCRTVALDEYHCYQRP